MTEEIKKEQASVRSFRITDEVMGRFKEIQDETGLTTDGALKMFIASYEMEQAKNTIPDRETEITNFQTKANQLVEAFLYSLQLNQDAETRIRSDVELQLKSKDEQIIKLQAEVRAKEELAVTANTAAFDAENKRKQAEQAMKDAQDKAATAEKTADDKIKIADMLQVKLTEAEAKLEDYPALKERCNVLEKDLSEALRTIEINKKDAEIAQERALAEKDQIIAAAELKAEKALSSLEKEKNAENQKLRDKIDELKDERAELKDEISKLREELAAIRKGDK